MKILAALMTQLDRETASLIEPAEARKPSDIVVGTVTCPESRKLYRLWKLALAAHNRKVASVRADMLNGRRPTIDLKTIMLSDAKVDCICHLLTVSVAADFPETLLELDRELVLCQGWELVMRLKEENKCTDPNCPVHGTDAVVGIMRPAEC